ncbi:MAG TPA: hypothetical protein ENI62_00650 [Gammaproteobacteria bacterium]|nr:hypothetical protein [Gammaproteobacteria bacterium]
MYGLLLVGLWLPGFSLAENPATAKIAVMGRNDMQAESGNYRQVVLIKASDGVLGTGLVVGARCDRVITSGHMLFDACGLPKPDPLRVLPRPWSAPGWSIVAKRIYGNYGKMLQSSGAACKALPQIRSRIRERLHLNELTILALQQPALQPGSCTAFTFPFQLRAEDRVEIRRRMKSHRLGPARVIGFERNFFGYSKRVSATGNLYFRQAGDWTYYRSPRLFQYDIDTLPGFSGGPVVIRYQNKNVVLGINILERFVGKDGAGSADYQAFSRANIGLLFPDRIGLDLIPDGFFHRK